MANQVSYGQNTSGTLGNTGSIFGLSQDEANFQMPTGPEVFAGTNQTGDDLGGRRGQHPGGTPTATVLQVMQSFYKLDADSRTQLTAKLAQAGYLKLPKKGKLSPHLVETAFKNAVIDAARSGTYVTDLLDQQISTGIDLGVGSGTTAQPIRATNPGDLTAIAQKEAQTRLGRDLTADEAAKVTAALSALEAPDLGAKGSTSPPGVGAFQLEADKQLHTLDPTRYDTRQVMGTFSNLTAALGAPSGG